MVTLISPSDRAVFDTHSDIQNEFIALIGEQGISAALDWLLPIKNGEELSRPRTLRLEWSSDGSSQYLLEVSENEDFSSPYTVRMGETSAVITNLKVGRKYYWRVNGGAHSSFITVDSRYRFVEVDGALNLRDLGGIGIKQGMIYRGSEINREYKITESGRRTMRDVLGIKTQLSLRGEVDDTDGVSVIGEGVQYRRIPYRPYEEIFEEKNRRAIIEIIDLFADETNYPIYFHCIGGADRTGSLAYVLNGVLGVEKEDLERDYESTFYNEGDIPGVEDPKHGRGTQHFDAGFAQYGKPGDTLRRRIELYLLDCGVTEEEIAAFRSIMLESP
jgi:protein-tyrosine phosphatase